MPLPSNGITPDVIREMMPPYHLSPDLLEATLAALRPPPPDATPTWRQTRLTRLTQEFATLMPANAAQARTVSQILIMRDLSDAIAARSHAPELTPEQMARVGRASAELARTAMGLVRSLERAQQKPVPFFGTVLADGVDVVALDAVWGTGAAGAQPGAGADASAPATAAEPAAGSRPRGAGGRGGAPTRASARRSCGIAGPFIRNVGDRLEIEGAR